MSFYECIMSLSFNANLAEQWTAVKNYWTYRLPLYKVQNLLYQIHEIVQLIELFFLNEIPENKQSVLPGTFENPLNSFQNFGYLYLELNNIYNYYKGKNAVEVTVNGKRLHALFVSCKNVFVFYKPSV